MDSKKQKIIPMKFRAWDGNTMYIQDNCYFTFGIDAIKYEQGEVYWSCYMYNSLGGHYCCDCTDKDVVLMRYTGLNDKHDNEIYEGDLVAFRHKDINNPADKKTIVKCEVVWSAKSGMWCLKWSDGKINEAPINNKSCEIVGNIYENKIKNGKGNTKV